MLKAKHFDSLVHPMIKKDDEGGSFERRLRSGPTKTVQFNVPNDPGNSFALRERYKYMGLIGSGRFGMVIKAFDLETGSLVAIKRILAPFGTVDLARRSYRELHLLQRTNHHNVISLVDAFMSSSVARDEKEDLTVEPRQKDLYLVAEYIPSDLRKILLECRNQPLPLPLTKWIIFEVLHGLAYLHAHEIIHRDVKPENLLLSLHQFDPQKPYERFDEELAKVRVKICDLGLARPADLQMTGYIATRFYRAPEIMLTWKLYGAPVDIWSVGCILAELATGKVLFPGRDHVHHLNMIIELVGSPSEAVVSRICSDVTRKYLEMLAPRRHVDFYEYFRGFLDPEGIDLLERLLEFDPESRITAQQAMQHKFFAEVRLLHDISDVGGNCCGSSCRLSRWPSGRDMMAEEISKEEIEELIREELETS